MSGRPTAAAEQIDHSVLRERAPSVAHLFRNRARQDAASEAYQYLDDADTVVRVTWGEAHHTVTAWAAGLVTLGVGPGDRMAIASTTRFEWVVADLAVMCAGGATTTVYPNTNESDVAYLLADSGSVVVFAEDAAQVAKLRGVRDALPGVVRIVTFDPAAADGDWVITTETLEGLGTARLEAEPGVVDERIDALGPDDLATIIYTSGTTGPPKGVELTHDAFVYAAAAADAVDLMRPDDLQFLWLPLSHVFGKVLLTIPIQIGFPTAVDGRLDRIVDNLAVFRPTWMGAAPRIFEKARARVVAVLAGESGPKAAVASWAIRVGHAMASAREAGAEPSLPLRAAYRLADRLVLSTIRECFGGRVRFFISGSAPLDPDVARWFAAVGLLVCEGYGLTETAAFSCVNRPTPGSYAFGTIGWPAPGTEITLAPDGELLVRSPGVMRGYHNRPEATAEVFTADGRFATGDIGEIDERGFVTVTDRKKDLFKTSGGKYVAPSRIEAHLKGSCPYVSQVVVVGNGRPYAGALLTLDEAALREWAGSRDGLAGLPYADLVASQPVRDLVQGYVDELNRDLNRWETIKRFAILERDLTVEDDELTPSLKLKRKVVTEKFAGAVDSLYEASRV